jgi:hypothetical protein
MVMSGKIVMDWQASAFAEDFNLHCAIPRLGLRRRRFGVDIFTAAE